MLHAFFCVNLPLFCKVDKASIIFFSRIVCYISGHCLSNFQKTQRRNQGIFPAIKRFTIPSDKNAHALMPSLSGMDMTSKIWGCTFASTSFLSLNSTAVAWDIARLVIATSESLVRFSITSLTVAFSDALNSKYLKTHILIYCNMKLGFLHTSG